MQENEDGRERCVGEGTRMCTQDKWEGEGHSGWVCGAPRRERDQGSPEDWLSLPAKQTAFTMVHAQDGTGLSVQCVCLTAPIPLTVPTGPHMPLGTEPVWAGSLSPGLQAGL